MLLDLSRDFGRPGPPFILHVMPTFAVGGVQVRTTEIINALGDAYLHAIIALDGNYSCTTRLAASAPVKFPFCSDHEKHVPGTLLSRRTALQNLKPNLLLTYNWGTIEWALANTISPLCQHIHLEDGFGIEEADRQLARRVYFRRIALARTDRVVVPSKTLVHIATRFWKLPQKKVVYIPNGIDASRFNRTTEGRLAGNADHSDHELVIGTLAPLRPEKNLGFLLDAFATLCRQFNAKLVIIGEGPERQVLVERTKELGISDRVEFAGHIDAIEKVLADLDIFALTSKTEQMPFSVLQAMAAGKPVAAIDVGDVEFMLSPENRPYVAPKHDLQAFVNILAQLIRAPEARVQIGARNRAHVREAYPHERMIAAHRELFTAATGHRDIRNLDQALRVDKPPQRPASLGDN